MKRIVQFDHLFLTTMALLAIAGCGENKNKEPQSFSATTTMETTRDLTANERAIATRVCYAYQSKNTSFKTQTYFGGAFTFGMSNKSCATTSSEAYSVTGTLTTSTTDGSLFYATSSTKAFEPKVQTSQSGFLSQLCAKIQNNLAISNTAVVNNVTVQVAFTSPDIDSYTLTYFSKVDTAMKIQSAETFKVRTQFNQTAGQILGMDEIYSKIAVCPTDASKSSELIQTFQGYVPQ